MDEAVELARRQLGGATVTFGWGGRVRIVMRDGGWRTRWRAAMTAPAYRTATKAFRTVQALRHAVAGRGAQVHPPSALERTVLAHVPGLQGLEPVSAIIGTPGLSRSIVLTLVDERARPSAVMKIAASPGADAAVRREADALADPAVAECAPHLLWSGDVEGHAAVATAYVSGTSGSVGPHGVEEARYLVGRMVQQDHRLPAEHHPWVQDVMASSELPEELLDDLGGTWPRVRIHGDLAPWNIVRRKDGTVLAIDWEDSLAEGFPGIDLAHHVMVTSMAIHHEAPGEAAQRATAALTGSLECDDRTAGAVVRLTAAFVLARLRRQGVDAPERGRWRRIAYG